jgi:site-specific recombinase XerD
MTTDPARPTIATTQPADITVFLTDLTREAKAEKTWRAYRSDLTLFATWFTQTTGDPFAAEKLTRIDVRDYKQRLLAVEGKAAATVNRRLAALRAFCSWSKRTGRVTELATEGIADVPVPRQAPKALDERVIDRVLRRVAQAGNRRDHAILMTLRHTGLRVAELCDLRIGDVVTSERKGTLTVRAGKGMKQRTVPLNADVRRVLATYLDHERQGAAPAEFVFLSGRTKSRLTEKAVRQVAAKYGYLAMVEDAHPHAFRHSFATELLRKGTPLTAVGALLGHESLQSTARYTQPSAKDLREAVGKLALETERDEQERGR